jgi:hypothetical protein
VPEKDILPIVTVDKADREAGREAAKLTVLPENAGLRGEGTVERQHLAHVAFAAKAVEAPIIQVLADHGLRPLAAGPLRDVAQLLRDTRVRKHAPHLLKLRGRDQKAI